MYDSAGKDILARLEVDYGSAKEIKNGEWSYIIMLIMRDYKIYLRIFVDH